MELAKVILGSGKDQSIRRFHPWVFSGAIKKIKGMVAEGDLVSVFDNKEELLGFGHYAEGSIAVRMLGFGANMPREDYIEERISRAWKFRTTQLGLNRPDNNVFRLVFAEGDMLPGLILDYYDGHVVMQCHSYGMYLEREKIVHALQKVLGQHLKSVFDKSAESLHYQEVKALNQSLLGEGSGTTVLENGFKFNINWEQGQKTGFFIDQRENRVALKKYCEGKKVLNTFCYTGGFSVYAMGSGAQRVVSVDSSGRAMDLCKENIALNFGDDPRHSALCTDVFDFLEQTEERFDVIILDPPAFAKHINVRHKAVQGYKRLNQTAIRKLNQGGVLLTFSCSQAVEKNLFFSTVTAASILAGRPTRFLEYLHQPADHGYSVFHPEGEYLKGIALHFE